MVQIETKSTHFKNASLIPLYFASPMSSAPSSPHLTQKDNHAGSPKVKKVAKDKAGKSSPSPAPKSSDQKSPTKLSHKGKYHIFSYFVYFLDIIL